MVSTLLGVAPHAGSISSSREGRESSAFREAREKSAFRKTSVNSSARKVRETRLLGESQIVDGPNVRDEPTPPKPTFDTTKSAPYPTEKKSPQVTEVKQPDKKKTSVSKALSPKPMSPKPMSPKSTPPKKASPQKEVRPKVKAKDVSPQKDKGEEDILTEVITAVIKLLLCSRIKYFLMMQQSHTITPSHRCVQSKFL